MPLGGGPAGEKDLDGGEDLSSPEGRPRTTTPEQGLVDVVVEDGPEALAVEAREAEGEPTVLPG